MNAVIRLCAVLGAALLLLVASGYLTDPRWAMLLGLIANTIAAPFGERLCRWVDDGSAARRTSGSAASTALIVCAAYAYVFLVINLFGSSVVSDFDDLERRGLVTFTAEGYREAQLYAAGGIGAPLIGSAIVLTSSFIGASSRPATLASFALGIYAAVPVFFVIARSAGLPVGFEHPTIWTTLQSVTGIVVFGGVLALISWGIARFSRSIARRL